MEEEPVKHKRKPPTSSASLVTIRGYTYDTNVPPLGNGSYGVVYKGIDQNVTPPRDIAIKKVALYGKNIEQGVSCELLREFSFLHTLHRNKATERRRGILFPTDMFIHDGYAIMIYPLLEETLFHYLTRTTSQSRRQNIWLFQSIINELIHGLHFCAQYNIRHNDVHASNVLVTIPEIGSGMKTQPIEVKLTDLGLCTYEPSLPWLAWSNLYEWSYYQAPELAKCILHEPIHKSFVIDSRVDVWSLGVIIIEYGAPHSIKESVQKKLYPQYKYNPSAHPTNRNDTKTIRLSMQGSTEYYNLVMKEWKDYMTTETVNQPHMKQFYTRLFLLLKNIFTNYKMRWNIRTCYEYWIERKCKLIIHDYSLHDRTWLSKFCHILIRFQQHPLRITMREPTLTGVVEIWPHLIEYWFDQSKNIIYTLECFRLLYDYLVIMSNKPNRIDRSTQDACLVYRLENASSTWTLSTSITSVEWDELNQAVFGLVHKLLHNVPRNDFKVNVQAERAFLDAVGFNLWSSWILSPMKQPSLLTFDPKREKGDLQTIQNVFNKIPPIN